MSNSVSVYARINASQNLQSFSKWIRKSLGLLNPQVLELHSIIVSCQKSGLLIQATEARILDTSRINYRPTFKRRL